MEPLTKADRICAVTLAAAHDLNEELTVILISVSESLRALGPGHPARPRLLEARSAVQRLAWTTFDLLIYTRRNGARPSAVHVTRMLEEDLQARIKGLR